MSVLYKYKTVINSSNNVVNEQYKFVHINPIYTKKYEWYDVDKKLYMNVKNKLIKLDCDYFNVKEKKKEDSYVLV